MKFNFAILTNSFYQFTTFLQRDKEQLWTL